MADIDATAKDVDENMKDLQFDSDDTVEDGFIDIRIDADKEKDDILLDLSPDEHHDSEPQEEEEQEIHRELTAVFDSSEHQLIGESILAEQLPLPTKKI